MKKNSWVNIAIIAAVLIIAFFVLRKPTPVTTEEIARCIGENSVLYVQLGCPHCKTQEDMFGNNKQYLKIVDCFYETASGKCTDIQSTPTWLISGKKYEGVQSIEKLQELTGC
jgi:hypothetical protein